MLVFFSEVHFFKGFQRKSPLAQSDVSVKRIVLTHFYVLIAPETFKYKNCHSDEYVSASHMRCYKYIEIILKQ